MEWDAGMQTKMKSYPWCNASRQNGSWQYRSSTRRVTPKDYGRPAVSQPALGRVEFTILLLRAVLRSNEFRGQRDHFVQPGFTSTGVRAVWLYVTEPLAWCRVEQFGQWIVCEEKYSVPSKASSRVWFTER